MLDLRTIGIVFRKELVDTLRDRKTLLFMVALPVLLMPGLSSLMTRVTQREAEKTQTRRLVVQCEPAERDRLQAFLRARLAPLEAAAAPVLALLGKEVREPLDALAATLGRSRLETLVTFPNDPAAQAHPRAAELRAALAGAHRSAERRLREGKADDPELRDLDLGNGGDPRVRDLHRFLALLSPLVTIDYVPAAEVAARPDLRAPPADADLPADVRGDPRTLALARSIATERIHAGLRVPAVLDATVAARDDTVELEVVYDSTLELSQEAQRRLAAAMETAADLVVDERLAREDLPRSFVTPVTVDSRNAARREKEILKLVASFLPYILILMCFVGGIYPATDLGAGEKERLTLETLLVAPPRRIELALGKFGVIFLSSLTAGVLATVSMAWTFASGLASPQLAAAFDLRLAPSTLLVCLALIAPLAATFAAVMLALSIWAKSQKEAQSLMMPLQFLIIVPAVLSMIPSIRLDSTFAWIPVMNVALGLRAVLTAGGAELPWTELAIIAVSTTLFAALALGFCARRFSQESVIFRT